MKIESNKNWTTCLRLNTGDGSPRVFLLNSHFLGSVPNLLMSFLLSCVVELTIAEMACVSSNVRRTFHVPSVIRVQRSISERDCSHPYFSANSVTNLILMRLPFSSVLWS